MRPSESSQCRKYGLTYQQLQILAELQGHKCGVCASELHDMDPGEWVHDHNHVSTLIRGLLCRDCNLKLGHLGDSVEGVVEWIHGAITYLIASIFVPDFVASLREIEASGDSIRPERNPAVVLLINKNRELRQTLDETVLRPLLGILLHVNTIVATEAA